MLQSKVWTCKVSRNIRSVQREIPDIQSCTLPGKTDFCPQGKEGLGARESHVGAPAPSASPKTNWPTSTWLGASETSQNSVFDDWRAFRQIGQVLWTSLLRDQWMLIGVIWSHDQGPLPNVFQEDNYHCGPPYSRNLVPSKKWPNM